MKTQIVVAMVLVTVVSFSGCLDLGGGGGKANKDPVALISYPQNNNEFSAKSQIYFDGSNSSDLDGGSIDYQWESSISGIIDRAARFSKALAAGTHTITLTVTDTAGGEATDTVTITVKANIIPLADAGDDKTAWAGSTVVFNASNSQDADGTITRYSWDFDAEDGIDEDAVGWTVRHSYGAPGIYTVTLTVFDDGGASAQSTCDVEVQGTAVETDEGNDGTITIVWGLDNDKKHHWDMPDEMTRVVATLSWTEENWNLEFSTGTGECPHNGEALASATSSDGYIIVQYDAPTGYLETGQWFVHIKTLNEDEHMAETCDYEITVTICQL